MSDADANIHAVFPELKKLVEEHPADEHRYARVPDTDVYVLYGIHEGRHEVEIISIRTWDPLNG